MQLRAQDVVSGFPGRRSGEGGSRTSQVVLFALIVCGSAVNSWAQWIHHPTPGIPRTADGRADLSAPAPRAPDGRPDLSGMWGWQPGRYFGSLTQDLKPEEIKPWARALAAERIENMGKDDPSNFLCMPQGPRLN